MKRNKFLWFVIIGLSVYYFYRAIRFRFFQEGIGETLWDKQFWFVFHVTFAVVPLALGPLQFWKGLRLRYPKWHRRLGRAYLAGSLFGGVSAFYLGVTQPYEGSIVPVVLLSILWIGATVAAWMTILAGNVVAHRLFVIRSYVMALTFVSLRIWSDLVEHANILFFIDSPEIRDTTYEWLSWVVPLVIMEMILTWIPQLGSATGSGHARRKKTPELSEATA